MSKPPPIPPPPIKLHENQSNEVNQTRWMIALAILMGALLAVIIIASLPIQSNIGEEQSRTETGVSENVAASMGAGSDSAEAIEPVFGNDSQTKEGANAVDADVESDLTKNEANTAESSDSESTDEIEKNQEVQLLMVEKKPAVGKSSRTDASSKSLDGVGGVNPFIGSGMPAKSTVFVIDVSGSMQTQDRLPRVIATLKRALDLLKPNQKFQVVLFDNGFHLHPVERGLISANERNKKTICDWLDHGINGSGTNPIPAMLFAVQQGPERIVLLSDGEFDPSSEIVITRANRSNPQPAIIDCVGLMEEVETLKSIAQSNKGIYYQAY